MPWREEYRHTQHLTIQGSDGCRDAPLARPDKHLAKLKKDCQIMGDLVQFARRVKQRLADANREPHWEPGEADRYMADVGNRRERFEQLATRLIATVIQPRLETLASNFSNASLTNSEPASNRSCWFEYCERFPASTKISFAVVHDVRIENVFVSFEASMAPLFIKLNEHDKLTTSISDVREDVVADWVEGRLLEFLDSYLRIDRGGDDFDDEATTDPVCGMRINRSSAVASGDYRGHPYFFCSRECQERFLIEPTAYVAVKAI